MAWSVPMTVVEGQQISADFFNHQVRDNLLESGPAKVTEPGQYLVGAGFRRIEPRSAVFDQDFAPAVIEHITEEDFYDGDDVENSVRPPAPRVENVRIHRAALVLWATTAGLDTTNGTGYISFEVDGPSRQEPTDDNGIRISGLNAGFVRWSGASYVTGLVPGEYTFTLKYRIITSTTNLMNVSDRHLAVLPL